MILDPSKLTSRDKQVLTGLYLAKFDKEGLAKLGFETFTEGMNAVGYALGGRPLSIKNYRDEFDPLFPNPRQGWHKRKRREYCMRFFEEYRGLDLEVFASLIKSFVGYDQAKASELEDEEGESSYAKRLITGVAAENYFEAVWHTLSEFEGLSSVNTTRLGCGFDFRLSKQDAEQDFLAVEVKGLAQRFGGLSLTTKEHTEASRLADRYFLFVVRNFAEEPNHLIYRNPLHCGLGFARKERPIVQVSWQTNISNNSSQ